MEFLIKFDTVKSAGWSIVYFEGSQVIIKKKQQLVFLSLKIDFCLEVLN